MKRSNRAVTQWFQPTVILPCYLYLAICWLDKPAHSWRKRPVLPMPRLVSCVIARIVYAVLSSKTCPSAIKRIQANTPVWLHHMIGMRPTSISQCYRQVEDAQGESKYVPWRGQWAAWSRTLNSKLQAETSSGICTRESAHPDCVCSCYPLKKQRIGIFRTRSVNNPNPAKLPSHTSFS